MKSFSSSLHILRLKSMSMFTSPSWEEGGGGGVQGAHGVTAGASGGGGGYRSRTDSSRSSFDRRCACVKLETWLLCWNRVLGSSPLSSLSHLSVCTPPAPQLWTELFYFNLILYAKQEWLVRSLSLLGVLISEYFQLHKWISSVLTSKKTLWKPLNFVLKWEGQGLIKSLGVNDIVITRCLYIDDYLIKFILPRRCPFHISALTMAVAPGLLRSCLLHQECWLRSK